MCIWRLEASADKKWIAIRPRDILYFQKHFTGEILPDDWQPPDYEIAGQSKKIPDLIGWMVCAPVVSERFADAFSHLSGEFVQFLPFGQIKGKQTYAMNVIKVEKNILDLNNSIINYADEERKFVTSIEKTVFKNLPKEIPPIFKIEKEFSNHIYVNEEFCRVVIEKQLTGICLADPKTDSFKMMLKGLDRNVYLGVPKLV